MTIEENLKMWIGNAVIELHIANSKIQELQKQLEDLKVDKENTLPGPGGEKASSRK